MLNVIDIKSEKYFRHACDYFFFGDNPTLSLECLKEVLKRNKTHQKALYLKGEVLLYTDKLEEALECFYELKNLEPCNFRNLANIALCEEMNDNLNISLKYCNSAIKYFDKKEEKEFLTSLYDLKISLLLQMKKEKVAKKLLISLKNVLPVFCLAELEKSYGWLKKRDTKNVCNYLKLVK